MSSSNSNFKHISSRNNNLVSERENVSFSYNNLKYVSFRKRIWYWREEKKLLEDILLLLEDTLEDIFLLLGYLMFPGDRCCLKFVYI